MYILIPLKSKKSSKNWRKVEELFNNTLRSVTNQKCNDYKVLIAVHDIPKITYNIPKNKYEFIKVNYPPPENNYKDQLIDKYYKKRILVYEIFKKGNAPFMFIDADDYISNRIVCYAMDFFKKNKDINLLYTCNEWEYDCRSKKLIPNYHLKDIPGPSSIFNLPDEFMIKEFVFEGYKRKNIYVFDYGHNEWLKIFKKQGLKVRKIPFRSALYLKFNSENHSVMWGERGSWKRNIIRKILGRKKISSKIRDEFSFYL